MLHYRINYNLHFGFVIGYSGFPNGAWEYWIVINLHIPVLIIKRDKNPHCSKAICLFCYSNDDDFIIINNSETKKKLKKRKGEKQTDQKSNTEYLLENKGIFNIQGTILTTSFMIKHDMFILYVAALSGPNEIESQLARGRPNHTECKQQEKWV